MESFCDCLYCDWLGDEENCRWVKRTVAVRKEIRAIADTIVESEAGVVTVDYAELKKRLLKLAGER